MSFCYCLKSDSATGLLQPGCEFDGDEIGYDNILKARCLKQIVVLKIIDHRSP